MTNPATPLCACGQPSPDAILCRTCTGSLARSLAAAAVIGPDLDDAVARLLKRGSGGKRTGDDNPLPIDTGAMDARDQLRNCLSGWVRVLLDVHPGPPYPPGTIASMARWLGERTALIRQAEWAAAMLADIQRHVQAAVAVIERKPELVPAGTCEACGSLLLAELGTDTVRCSCGMVTIGIAEKRAQRAAAADVLGSAGEISGALAKIGIQVPRGTITSWASRGRLAMRPGGVYAMSEVLALASERTAR